MKLLAKTLHGLEEVLAKEITALGGMSVEVLKRAVSFHGPKEVLYRCNYELRTAIRILKPVYTFVARSERQLYHKISTYNWEIHFDVNQTFAISSNVRSTHFTHSQYVALKAKDAIVDQFRNKTGKRPSVDARNPDIQLNIHCNEDEFTVSLDSTGESLHRRGYREMGHAAPLNEVLAAGMLQLAEWERETPFMDAMCGTGTLLFEAAMLGAHIPAGHFRYEKYNMQNWKDFDKELFETVKKNADARINKEGLQIKGGDSNPAAVRQTQQTIDDLQFGDIVKVERIPFKRHKPIAESGLLIMNPPYGERMGIRDINKFYEEMGDVFKTEYSGWTAWLISSNIDAIKSVGLKTSRKLHLFNGSLECKYHKYELYRGTKKKKNEEEKE